MSKNDKQLGKQVNEYLAELGIHTPVVQDRLEVSSATKIKKISELYKEIMEVMGLDLNDDSLQDTPNRVAKMYVNEIMSGLVDDTFPKCTTVENKFTNFDSEDGDDIIVVKNITGYSLCEHHAKDIIPSQTKTGGFHIGYIPVKGGKVLGLSKLNRIVQYFCQRPQVQERLTQQILHTIKFVSGCEDVIVAADLVHMCVASRGIKDTLSSTVTIATSGRFAEKNSELRKEFMSNINS